MIDISSPEAAVQVVPQGVAVVLAWPEAAAQVEAVVAVEGRRVAEVLVAALHLSRPVGPDPVVPVRGLADPLPIHPVQGRGRDSGQQELGLLLRGYRGQMSLEGV